MTITDPASSELAAIFDSVSPWPGDSVEWQGLNTRSLQKDGESLRINQTGEELKNITRETVDWVEWLRRNIIQLHVKSPFSSPALRNLISTRLFKYDACPKVDIFLADILLMYKFRLERGSSLNTPIEAPVLALNKRHWNSRVCNYQYATRPRL